MNYARFMQDPSIEDDANDQQQQQQKCWSDEERTIAFAADPSGAVAVDAPTPSISWQGDSGNGKVESAAAAAARQGSCGDPTATVEGVLVVAASPAPAPVASPARYSSYPASRAAGSSGWSNGRSEFKKGFHKKGTDSRAGGNYKNKGHGASSAGGGGQERGGKPVTSRRVSRGLIFVLRHTLVRGVEVLEGVGVALGVEVWHRRVVYRKLIVSSTAKGRCCGWSIYMLERFAFVARLSYAFLSRASVAGWFCFRV